MNVNRGRVTLTRGSVAGGTQKTASLLNRERLLSALDEAATKRVTVISAPAGSGKTSLLRTWIERSRGTYRVIFTSARGGEEEQVFWLSLLTGLQHARGGRNTAGTPTPTPGFSGAAMVDRFLSEVGEDSVELVVVIDDAHELGKDALTDVAALLAALPLHVHAVLATRRDLRLGMHQLRVAGELAELRAENLNFTVSETRELLRSNGIALSDNAVQTLQQRTEGWAAGLRLAVLSLAVDSDPETFVGQFSGNNRVVAEYLMAEMLERQPPPVQRLLLATSILDRVNGELADLLSETTGSDRILLGLEDANAFVVSVDSERRWFRYHHLFRELLRLELRRTTPSSIAGLHRRAAGWFVEHGQVIDAIRHTQAAGDWKLAAEMLADSLFDLLMNGHNETIEALLEAFPHGTRSQHPELALVNAALEILQGRFTDATPHLDVAERHAEKLPTQRQPGFRVGIASLRLELARRQGQFDHVVDQVNYLASPAAARFISASAFNAVLRAVALMNLGIVEMWSGRFADAEMHLREGAALAHRIGQPYLELACLSNLGFPSKIRSVAAMRRYSEEAIALADRYGWANEPIIVPALVTIGCTFVCAGDFSEGERWLVRASNINSADTNPPAELVLHVAKGMLYAGRRQLREALDEFQAAERMQSLMLGEHALAEYATGWTIATKARLGMLDEARASLADIPPARANAAETRNADALISLVSGDPDAALNKLRDVFDGRVPIIHDFTRVESHLLAARAYRALGDERDTRKAVENALAIAERDRLILPFAMTDARELLEAQPRQTTAHAALLLEIQDILTESSPRADSAILPANELSKTELRVLRYLPTNLSRSGIARELFVSVNTLNSHMRNIYSKLGASNRTEAVERARALRLLAH